MKLHRGKLGGIFKTSTNTEDAMINFTLSRRDWLSRMGGGFGTLGLASVLAEAGLLDTENSAGAAEASPSTSSASSSAAIARCFRRR